MRPARGLAGLAVAVAVVAVVWWWALPADPAAPGSAPPDGVRSEPARPVRGPEAPVEPATAESPPVDDAPVPSAPIAGAPVGSVAAGRAVADPPAGPGDTAEDDRRSVWPATAAGIGSAMKEALPAIKDCYEGWLASEPGLSGKVVVQFTLTAGGDGSASITEARASEGTGSAGFDACVTQVASTLEFDAPEGGRTLSVSYPFLFAPG